MANTAPLVRDRTGLFTDSRHLEGDVVVSVAPDVERLQSRKHKIRWWTLGDVPIFGIKNPAHTSQVELLG